MVYDIYFKTTYKPIIFEQGLAQDQLNSFISGLTDEELKQIYILPRKSGERKDDKYVREN